MIHDVMEWLRVDRECDHANWRYRHGGGRCESCHHDLPLYLFVSGLFVYWRADHGGFFRFIRFWLSLFSAVKDVRCWSAIAVGATGSRFPNDGRTVEDTYTDLRFHSKLFH